MLQKVKPVNVFNVHNFAFKCSTQRGGRNDDTWECGRCGKEIQPLPQSLAGVQLASGDGKASPLFCSILKRNRNVARLVHSGLLYPTFGDVYFPSLAVGKRHERPVCVGEENALPTHHPHTSAENKYKCSRRCLVQVCTESTHVGLLSGTTNIID